MKTAASGLVLFVLFLLTGCGSTETLTISQSATPTASATPTPTPSNPGGFGPNDCVDQPAGSPTAPLGDQFHVVVRMPPGWVQERPGQSETAMLVLDAPSSYSYGPTRIALLSLIGNFQSQTPDDVAKQFYGPAPAGGHPEFAAQLVGQLSDCTVASGPAAVFQYSAQRSQMPNGSGTAGQFSGYMVVFLHAQFAYALRVEGNGGLDPRAIDDAKKILGSWAWTAR